MFLPITGGGEFVVHHLANQWCKQGHEVCVFNSLTAEATHPEALYGVERYKIMRGATRFGYHRFPWVNVSTKSLNRLINKFNPDVISGHFAIPVAFYLANLKPARKWIITSHGADVVAGLPDSQRELYHVDDLLGTVLNKATAVVSISQIAQESIEQLGVDKSRIKYIPNGADIEKFSNRVDPNFKHENSIPNDAKFMLTIARNSAQKNLLLGIKAFAEIAETLPGLYYVIAGPGTTNLTSHINGYGLQNRIITRERLMGDELIAAYQQADIFLSTSYWEFCPLVILESMAAGLPLIATNVPGNIDLIEDGVNGVLVESNNHIDVAQAISKLMNDPSLCQSLKRANLEKVKSYSWDHISKRYLELF
jgi:glycosyltransferase involved in cell wall biosynthesis